MDPLLIDLKNRLSNGESETVLRELELYLTENPNSDEAYFLMGNAYRKSEKWGEAMNAYANAVELNPESPAKHAYQSIVEVLDFFNKDMYNQ